MKQQEEYEDNVISANIIRGPYPKRMRWQRTIPMGDRILKFSTNFDLAKGKSGPWGIDITNY